MVDPFGTPVDNTFNYLIGITELFGDNSQTTDGGLGALLSQPLDSPPQFIGYAPNGPEQPLPEQQLLLHDWPARLPEPALLRHLVDTFFNCYNHAHYLLHRPTFIASLALSPRSANFPHVSLLHAICAYASIFSYLVDSPPMPNLENYGGDVIFGDRRNRRNGVTDTFADQQIRWSKQAREEATSMGFNLKECAQGQLFVTSGLLTARILIFFKFSFDSGNRILPYSRALGRTMDGCRSRVAALRAVGFEHQLWISHRWDSSCLGRLSCAYISTS